MPKKPNQLATLDASNPARGCKDSLFGLDAEALREVVANLKESEFRSRQIAEAIYCQWIKDISEITTLPVAFRQRLVSQGWEIGRPTIARAFQSLDGTERYLIDFKCIGRNGETAEAVWMPEGDDGEAGDGSDDGALGADGAPPVSSAAASKGGDNKAGHITQSRKSSERMPWSRATICISSQVGCAVNCQFCLTAKLGLQRNLTAGEIVGQVVAVLERHSVRLGRDRVNLVFMGMGEPFLNYDNFMAAVRLLVREVGISPLRMTVSTSGIVPGIERFAEEPLNVRPKLAISLNAPNDTIRAEVMPVNRKWPIAAIVEAARRVPLRPRERITFEYVLLGSVTDCPEHAHELARLVRRTGLPVKVNLIAWNPGPGIAYTTPDSQDVAAFQAVLSKEGIPAYIRKPRGRDIFAACGQLKRTAEDSPSQLS
jgi:23S rRNA (adenine2503-C2)-methyltransferase